MCAVGTGDRQIHIVDEDARGIIQSRLSRPWGIGVCHGSRGNDVYHAGGVYLHAPLFNDRYQSFSQGFTIGDRNVDYAGGLAFLIDDGGNDYYLGDIYNQGLGYWYAGGFLVDRGGNDHYEMTQYGQGSRIHLAVGGVIDEAGNDSYVMNSGLGQGGSHDFAPSVMSLAGVKLPAQFQGTAFLGAQAGPPRQYACAARDRMDSYHDSVRVVRDAHYQYIRNFMPHLTWSQYQSYTEAMPTMRIWRELADQGKLTGLPARYFAPAKPVEELYDLAADPRQTNNLADNPAHRDTLERMRSECERWLLATGDLGLLPEYEMHQRANGRPTYELTNNSLPELLAAAKLANAMQPSNGPQLASLLTYADPALRWWGAVGL